MAFAFCRNIYDDMALVCWRRKRYDEYMNACPETFPRKIGILGGMGPAATVDLMQKIIGSTPSRCDQDHVPTIVWNVPQTPDRAVAILGNGESPVRAMREGARILARAGAQAIAIACNTAHYWSQDVEDASGLPLIHIVEAALAEMRAQAPTMLLATEATCAMGIYADRAVRYGVRLQIPDVHTQRDIIKTINAVKAGDLHKARQTLSVTLTRLQSEGVANFLLACTELPIAVRGTAFEAQSTDATAALARAIVAFSFRGTSYKTAAPKHRIAPVGNQVA
jgi:aspartate racemase